MRSSDFWARLDRALGESYSRSWAEDHVIAALGGRTAVGAMAMGIATSEVWRAVCDELELPPRLR